MFSTYDIEPIYSHVFTFNLLVEVKFVPYQSLQEFGAFGEYGVQFSGGVTLCVLHRPPTLPPKPGGTRRPRPRSVFSVKLFNGNLEAYIKVPLLPCAGNATPSQLGQTRHRSLSFFLSLTH